MGEGEGNYVHLWHVHSRKPNSSDENDLMCYHGKKFQILKIVINVFSFTESSI